MTGRYELDKNGQITFEADDATKEEDQQKREIEADPPGTAPQNGFTGHKPDTVLPTSGQDSDPPPDTAKPRPWLVPLFVTNMAFLILFYMFQMVYGGGVVRTLERRFDLRSTQTAVMSSSNDIIHVCIVVFIGYFARTAHKPRIICATVLFSSLAGFMMASPHFFMSGSSHDRSRPAGSASMSNGSDNSSSSMFCVRQNSSDDRCAAISGSSAPTSGVHPAYYVFVLAQFISGVGGSAIHTLSLTYIDENAPRNRAPFFIGVITSMYAFGPMGGMMLAAFTLRLPENLLSPAEGNPSDPTWIGCWWLGYVICATGILLSSIPLWFFPKTCKVTPPTQKLLTSQGESDAKQEGLKSFLKQEITEFPRRLLHLLKNKAYVVNLISVVCSAYTIIGIFANLVRYIEIHFLERAFVGSLVAGLVSALAGAVGGFAGGLLMTRLRLPPVGAVKIIIFSTMVFFGGLVVILFLSCPQLQMAGTISTQDNRFTVITDCNRQCACPTTRTSYAPVCGSDNLTYFSSCVAGCKNFTNGVYTDCTCVGSTESIADVGAISAAERSARPGLCRPPCNAFIPFVVTLFVMSLLGSVARVPFTVVNFRIVDDDERAFALSVNSFAINLLGFVPAPLLFGSLIDSTCILWQTTCGRTGSCLLYNTNHFRYATYGVALLFESIDLILAILLFLFVRKMVFKTPPDMNTAVQPEPEPKIKNKSLQASETPL